MASAHMLFAAKLSRRGFAWIANQWVYLQRSLDLTIGSEEVIAAFPPWIDPASRV